MAMVDEILQIMRFDANAWKRLELVPTDETKAMMRDWEAERVILNMRHYAELMVKQWERHGHDNGN